MTGRKTSPAEEATCPPQMTVHGDRAERWLKEGVFYAESLRNGRLRFSTVLPAWLGLDTLELLQRADRRHPSSGKVKIARGDVYFRMWKAFLFSWKEAL